MEKLPIQFTLGSNGYSIGHPQNNSENEPHALK